MRQGSTAAAALATVLLLASVPEAFEYGGVAGVLALLLLGAAGVALLPRVARIMQARVSPRAARMLAMVTLVLVAVALAMVYPYADMHFPGTGSDRDDALRDAATALMQGRHPYAEPTYLGNPITPLPGALLLAAPFVLTGAVWLHNVFWLGVFFLLARRMLGDDRLALLLFWCVLATPAALHEVAVGGDLLSNGIYVSAALLLFADALARERTSRLRASGAALFLGVAFASRLTYPYLFPLVLAYALRVSRPVRALTYVGLAGTTFVLLTLPLYLCSPERFAPLHVRGKVMRVAATLPRPDLMIPVIALLGALMVCVRMRPDAGSLLLRAAIVVGLPTVALLLAALVTPRAPLMEYLSIGTSYLPLAVLALGAQLLRRTSGARSSEPVDSAWREL